MKKMIFAAAASIFFFNSAKSQGGVMGTTNFNNYANNAIIEGGVIKAFNDAENTKGRRYLFDSWVKGSFINTQGHRVECDSFFYNFDKSFNNFIVTEDQKKVLVLSKDDIKSFTLKSHDSVFVFEKIEKLSPPVYLQLLTATDGKYKFYKLIKTDFEKSDYATDGLMETGKPYDEYVDSYVYYIKTPESNMPKVVELKSKSIKNALSSDKNKTDEFFSKNHSAVDEEYVTDLINYMNK